MKTKYFIGLDFGVRNIAITYIHDQVHQVYEIKLKNNDKTEPALEAIVNLFKKIVINNNSRIYLFFENIDTFEVFGVNKFKIPTIKLFQAIVDQLEIFKNEDYPLLQYATFNSSVVKMLQKRKYFARIFNTIKTNNKIKTLSAHAKDATILCYLAFSRYHAELFKYEKIEL